MENILKEFEVLQKNLNDLPIENLSDYDLSKTALFIVDINNGFAKEGARRLRQQELCSRHRRLPAIGETERRVG